MSAVPTPIEALVTSVLQATPSLLYTLAGFAAAGEALVVLHLARVLREARLAVTGLPASLDDAHRFVLMRPLGARLAGPILALVILGLVTIAAVVIAAQGHAPG
jgi:hypothetical protein